ncbi:TPA: protein kinase family protein [Bacillus cereus]|nr:protein kinase family protein [Bacillus thuringiensis]HDR8241324.1 protein kinase family protein [Bacillus cereus]
MASPTEEHLAGYISDRLESYLSFYGSNLNKRYIKFYEDIPAPLNKLFAFFHESFNGLLDFLNTKSRPGHYNADQSRMLYELIKDVKVIQSNLIDTQYDFEIDSYYSEVLGICKSFLKTSGGSVIPHNLQQVKIKELNPIFTLKSGLKVQRPNGVLTFHTEEIGVGSYATVFKFVDPFYDKVFAYKKAHTTLTSEEKERFYTEFEVMKGLKSPFILEVYTLDKNQNYYVMEYADETLENYIQRNPGLENEREKLIFIRQICLAFKRIHSKGVCHRDISPKNILIKHFDDTKMIKVADFGLVKVPESKLTRFATEPKGYLNDPHLRLLGFNNYKMHHDTYALTRLIYYMFTGRTDDGIFSNPHFEEFFKKGTHFETEHRYSNIQELETAFVKNVVPSLKEFGI